MKYLLLLITIASLSTHLQAQKWGNHTAVWRYHYSYNNHHRNLELKIEADTIILGKNCIKTGTYEPNYSYLSGDTVYFLKEGAFRPTYYFAAQAGDTISFFLASNIADNCRTADTRLAVVDTVDSINVGSKFIKHFSVTLVDDTSLYWLSPKKFRYYENAGTDNFIYPIFDCSTDPEWYTLCNYGDSSIAGFHLFPQNINECPLPTAISETQGLQVNHHWQSANVLNINLQEYASVSIYNAIGQCIHQSKAVPGNNAITFNQPQGIYILVAGSGSQTNAVKLYKQ